MNPSNRPPRPLRRLAPLLALSLAATAVGCMTQVQNGTTVTGNNVGRSLPVAGLASQPGVTIEVQVLDTPDLGAFDGTGTWVTIASIKADATPYPGSNPPMYLWSGNAVPVPNTGMEHRWPITGLVKLRALESGFPVITFDPSGMDCLVDEVNNGATWSDAGLACMSPSYPVVAVADVDPVPTGPNEFLVGITPTNSISDAYEYYEDIDAGPGQLRNTFEGWLLANGFDPDGTPVPGEIRAVYYNMGDLGLGRSMHCLDQGGGKKACYVTNYGGNFGDDAPQALNRAITQSSPIASVAMEYDPNADHDKVRFFAYNHLAQGLNGQPYAPGEILPEVILDNEGEKEVPGVCLSCHAGSFNPVTVTRTVGQSETFVDIEHNVDDARFLPFDPFSFVYSTTAGFTLNDQQEDFRELNALVRSTQTTWAIESLIDGLYETGSVNTPGTPATNTWIPVDWQGDVASETLYTEVVKPYCRTCHVAMGDVRTYDWMEYAEFESQAASIQYYACENNDMPYAELTQRHFWQSSARAHLTGILRLTGSCEGTGREVP